MLDREAVHAHCMAQPEAEETYPFGDDTRVYKVAGKVFALMPVQGELKISLKCDPVRAELLRETYPAVEPGYHLNKRHWNTVTVDGSVPDDEVMDLIDHSYVLVVGSLKKADRERLQAKLREFGA